MAVHWIIFSLLVYMMPTSFALQLTATLASTGSAFPLPSIPDAYDVLLHNTETVLTYSCNVDMRFVNGDADLFEFDAASTPLELFFTLPSLIPFTDTSVDVGCIVSLVDEQVNGSVTFQVCLQTRMLNYTTVEVEVVAVVDSFVLDTTTFGRDTREMPNQFIGIRIDSTDAPFYYVNNELQAALNVSDVRSDASARKWLHFCSTNADGSYSTREYVGNFYIVQHPITSQPFASTVDCHESSDEEASAAQAAASSAGDERTVSDATFYDLEYVLLSMQTGDDASASVSIEMVNVNASFQAGDYSFVNPAHLELVTPSLPPPLCATAIELARKLNVDDGHTSGSTEYGGVLLDAMRYGPDGQLWMLYNSSIIVRCFDRRVRVAHNTALHRHVCGDSDDVSSAFPSSNRCVDQLPLAFVVACGGAPCVLEVARDFVFDLRSPLAPMLLVAGRHRVDGHAVAVRLDLCVLAKHARWPHRDIGAAIVTRFDETLEEVAIGLLLYDRFVFMSTPNRLSRFELFNKTVGERVCEQSTAPSQAPVRVSSSVSVCVVEPNLEADGFMVADTVDYEQRERFIGRPMVNSFWNTMPGEVEEQLVAFAYLLSTSRMYYVKLPIDDGDINVDAGQCRLFGEKSRLEIGSAYPYNAAAYTFPFDSMRNSSSVLAHMLNRLSPYMTRFVALNSQHMASLGYDRWMGYFRYADTFDVLGDEHMEEATRSAAFLSIVSACPALCGHYGCYTSSTSSRPLCLRDAFHECTSDGGTQYVAQHSIRDLFACVAYDYDGDNLLHATCASVLRDENGWDTRLLYSRFKPFTPLVTPVRNANFEENKVWCGHMMTCADCYAFSPDCTYCVFDTETLPDGASMDGYCTNRTSAGTCEEQSFVTDSSCQIDDIVDLQPADSGCYYLKNCQECYASPRNCSYCLSNDEESVRPGSCRPTWACSLRGESILPANECDTLFTDHMCFLNGVYLSTCVVGEAKCCVAREWKLRTLAYALSNFPEPPILATFPSNESVARAWNTREFQVRYRDELTKCCIRGCDSEGNCLPRNPCYYYNDCHSCTADSLCAWCASPFDSMRTKEGQGRCMQLGKLERECFLPNFLYSEPHDCTNYFYADCARHSALTETTCENCVQTHITAGLAGSNNRCVFCAATGSCGPISPFARITQWHELNACGDGVSLYNISGQSSRHGWAIECCRYRDSCKSCLAPALDGGVLHAPDNAGYVSAMHTTNASDCEWCASNGPGSRCKLVSLSAEQSGLPCAQVWQGFEFADRACAGDGFLTDEQIVLIVVSSLTFVVLTASIVCFFVPCVHDRQQVGEKVDFRAWQWARVVLITVFNVVDTVTDWLFVFEVRNFAVDQPYSPLIGSYTESLIIAMLVAVGISTLLNLITFPFTLNFLRFHTKTLFRWHQWLNMAQFFLGDCVILLFQCIIASLIGIRGVIEVLAVIVTIISLSRGLYEMYGVYKASILRHVLLILMSIVAVAFMSAAIFLVAHIGGGNRGECGVVDVRFELAMSMDYYPIQCEPCRSTLARCKLLNVGSEQLSCWLADEAGQPGERSFQDSDWSLTIPFDDNILHLSLEGESEELHGLLLFADMEELVKSLYEEEDAPPPILYRSSTGSFQCSELEDRFGLATWNGPNEVRNIALFSEVFVTGLLALSGDTLGTDYELQLRTRNTVYFFDVAVGRQYNVTSLDELLANVEARPFHIAIDSFRALPFIRTHLPGVYRPPFTNTDEWLLFSSGWWSFLVNSTDVEATESAQKVVRTRSFIKINSVSPCESISGEIDFAENARGADSFSIGLLTLFFLPLFVPLVFYVTFDWCHLCSRKKAEEATDTQMHSPRSARRVR